MNRRTIDVIENAVTIRDVLSAHGKDLGRRGRCACPFHASRSDTFSYNDKLFHCFSCGESGGVIQLESALSCTSMDQACQTLAHAFNLDISDRPLTAEDKKNWWIEKQVEADYADYQQEKKNYYSRMTNLFRNIRTVPELYDMAKDLRDWLDDNLNGVTQPWMYQATQ